MKIPMNSDLLIWSSIILLAKSAYNDDLKTLIESKPDVNIHANKRTHFWVIIPRDYTDVDYTGRYTGNYPKEIKPWHYTDIAYAVKKQENFRYTENMKQFRSCKEHFDINDELFYRYDEKLGIVQNPISTRKEELEVSKTNCSVVLVQRSTKIAATELHHHLEKRTCNGLVNYCG